MVGKKRGGRAEAPCKKTPQPPTARLGADAVKALHRTARMSVGGSDDIGANSHPVAHRRHFAEGDAGLRHAPRAGIDADKQNALAGGGVFLQIHAMRLAGVDKRMIHMRHRRTECHAPAGGGERIGGGYQPTGNHENSIPKPKAAAI